LYFTTRSSPDEYVHGELGSGHFKFNVDFKGNVNLWVADAFGLTLDRPRITFFIAWDPDDGRPFRPSLDMERVVFSGTSIR